MNSDLIDKLSSGQFRRDPEAKPVRIPIKFAEPVKFEVRPQFTKGAVWAKHEVTRCEEWGVQTHTFRYGRAFQMKLRRLRD